MTCKYRSHKNKANNQQKVVHMLSTCHQPVVVNTNKKDRYGEFIYKPKVVKDYSMNMGGGDQIDQQLTHLIFSVNPISGTKSWLLD